MESKIPGIAPRKRRPHFLLRLLSSSGISLVVHAAIVALLIRIMVAPEVSDASRQITAALEEAIQEPVLDELDPLEQIPDDIVDPSPEMTPIAAEDVIVPEDATLGESAETVASPLTVPMLIDNNVSAAQLQRGTGTSFGFSDRMKGDLVGTMYDLKRSRSGSPRDADYLTDIRAILDGNLEDGAFRAFYRVPRPLYLTHLFVPSAPADNGPAAFGVGDLMEARKWVVHYAGEIQATIAGRYRFVGDFDDLVMVLIDGKVVQQSSWAGDPTPWQPKELVGRHPGLRGRALVYGDWVELSALRKHRIDILVGENPGGHIGGLLLVQREGETYDVAANGRPILPIFALQPLTPAEEKNLRSFAGWKFDPRIPILGARYDMSQRQAKKDTEVSIRIE